jgi:hypothetical protein
MASAVNCPCSFFLCVCDEEGGSGKFVTPDHLYLNRIVK